MISHFIVFKLNFNIFLMSVLDANINLYELGQCLDDLTVQISENHRNKLQYFKYSFPKGSDNEQYLNEIARNLIKIACKVAWEPRSKNLIIFWKNDIQKICSLKDISPNIKGDTLYYLHVMPDYDTIAWIHIVREKGQMVKHAKKK